MARYVVLTPFEQTDVLAGVCALAKFDVSIMATERGAVILQEMDVPQYDEWDIRNITGPTQEDLARLNHGKAGDSGPGVASYVSRLSPYGSVLFTSTLGDSNGFEEGVCGNVSAQRYLAGVPKESLSASLILMSLDSRVETFLLGEVDLPDLPVIKASELKSEDVEAISRAHNLESAPDEDTFSGFGHSDVDFDEGSEYL